MCNHCRSCNQSIPKKRLIALRKAARSRTQLQVKPQPDGRVHGDDNFKPSQGRLPYLEAIQQLTRNTDSSKQFRWRCNCKQLSSMFKYSYSPSGTTESMKRYCNVSTQYFSKDIARVFYSSTAWVDDKASSRGSVRIQPDP